MALSADKAKGEAIREDLGESFAALVLSVEPALRRALVAAYGPEVGRDAAADALAWAWEHFDQVAAMARPAGYLWRVGQSSARAQRRPLNFEVPHSVQERGAPPSVSPRWDEDLFRSLERLSTRQRAAVVLVHAYGYPLAEAAAALDCRVSTLRNHLARGLRKVRADLERRAE